MTVEFGTGTPFGQSFWREVAFKCPRRAALKKMASEERGAPMAPSEDLRLEVGTIGHALLDTYLTCPQKKQNFRIDQINWAPYDPTPMALAIAWRTFEAFRFKFKPTDFGELIGTEYDLPFPCKKVCKTKHKCKKHLPDQVLQLADTFNLPSLTARLDFVSRIRKQADVKRYKKLFDVDVTPGYWIHDWKFVKTASSWTAEKYYNDLQPRVYMRAWDACHPLDRQCQGVLYHLIEKLEDNKYEFNMLTIRIPQLKPVDLAMLELFSEMALRNYHYDPAVMAKLANIEMCDDWGRPCQFLIDGQCSRC